MDEVTKLYENANIKQDRMCEWTCRGSEYCSTNCEHYESTQLYYPPFTSEKQIKIIEWLGNSKAFFDANETIFSLITNHKNKNGVVKGYEGKGNSVDSCLASLINNLWQDLTDAEKAQIKNILESEVRE